MASYEFSPLPDSLADVLAGLVGACGDEGGVAPRGLDPGCMDELRDLGYLAEVRHYLDGNSYVRVAARGMRYERELADWASAREEERSAAEGAIRSASRREWAIGIIGALATIASGVIGYLMGLAS